MNLKPEGIQCRVVSSVNRIVIEDANHGKTTVSGCINELVHEMDLSDEWESVVL